MSLLKAYTQTILKHPLYNGIECIQDSRVLAFNLSRPLAIKLDLYVDHFLYQINLPEDILVASMILIDKYLSLGLVCSHNIHRIVFTSLSISLKFLVNFFTSNESLEKIGIMKKGSLIHLELEMLKFVNWKPQFNRFYEMQNQLLQISSTDDRSTSCDELSDEDVYIPENDESCGNCSELQAFFNLDGSNWLNGMQD